MSKRADTNTTHTAGHPIFIRPENPQGDLESGLARLGGASKTLEALAMNLPDNPGPTETEAIRHLAIDIRSLYEQINDAITAMNADVSGSA